MPEQLIEIDARINPVLEAVRAQQGLETLGQAAEWLIRSRLRKGTKDLTGRGRALYPIDGGRR